MLQHDSFSVGVTTVNSIASNGRHILFARELIGTTAPVFILLHLQSRLMVIKNSASWHEVGSDKLQIEPYLLTQGNALSLYMYTY